MTKKILSVIMIITLVVGAFTLTTPAVNQRWRFDFEAPVFSTYDEWNALYGCDVEITNEEAHSGSRSLKIYNRQHAWSTAAFDLGRVFYEGGAGLYVITVWVKVVNVATDGRGVARSMIRAASSEASFIEQYANNSYGTVRIERTPEDTWVCLQGSINVYSDDIDKGYFKWMLDVIDLADDQVVYIDDFDIFKSSDYIWETDVNGIRVPIKVHHKAYEPNYNYGGNITNSLQYYNAMASVDPLQHVEFVYTFKNQSHAAEFKRELNDLMQAQWVEEQWNTYINSIQTCTNAIISELVPGYGELMTIIDLYQAVQDVDNLFNATMDKFEDDFTYVYDLPSTEQTMVTYSVCVLRHVQTNAMEYRIMRSDNVEQKVCSISPETYSVLLGYLNKYVDGSTHNTPTVSTIHPNYLYSQSNISGILSSLY